MKILSLGLRSSPEEVRARLQHECCQLVQEGFRVAIDETNKGRYTFLGCNIAEGELSYRNYERVKNTLKTCVAQMLAEFIIAREEKDIIRKTIDQNYYYFSEQEKTLIFSNAVNLLDSGGLFSDFSYAARSRGLFNKLHDYLDLHHELVLDGFLAFRLKDYRERLVELVNKAVDEYMKDLEYKEFIRVLRYFVDVQEAQVDEVHIVLGEGEGFNIRDSRGYNISNHYLETATHRGEEINYEDLVISALITIAPQTVTLHYASAAKAPTLVETITNVFEGRVAVCPGCDMCRGGASVPETERN